MFEVIQSRFFDAGLRAPPDRGGPKQGVQPAVNTWLDVVPQEGGASGRQRRRNVLVDPASCLQLGSR